MENHYNTDSSSCIPMPFIIQYMFKSVVLPYWSDHFHLPLSTEAFNQFNELGNIVPQLNSSGKDQWGCNGQTTTYSSMQMYSNLMENGEEHPIFKLIWKSKRRLKRRIFLWLAAHERINTRALLKRKGMHLENPFCPNCNQDAVLCIFFGIVILPRIAGLIATWKEDRNICLRGIDANSRATTTNFL